MPCIVLPSIDIIYRARHTPTKNETHLSTTYDPSPTSRSQLIRMKNATSIVLFISLSLALSALAEIDTSKLPPAATKKNVEYAADIKPLFEASCVRCHSGDRPKAGLRLDRLESVLKGSKDGKVIEKGDSAKSLLVHAISQLDPEIAMPPKRRSRGPGGPGGPSGGGERKDGPPGKNSPPGKDSDGGSRGPGGPGGFGGPPPKPLTAEEVGLVRAWIDQGAK